LSTTATRPESPLTLEQEDLRSVSRTIAEIHGLLLILIVLYVVFGGVLRDDAQARTAVTAGLVAYAVIVVALRYAGMARRESRWKIAIETLCMTAIISWVLTYTGGLASPLLSTYLLPVVIAALTLGRLITLVQVGLVAACEIYLKGASPDMLLSLPVVGELAAQLAPVLLVAYVTSLFSADIRFGLNRARLASETDQQTGMYNPRGFAIVASRSLAQASRHGRPTSVLMIDCDNLKPVNDQHGHEVGDEIVRRLGEIVLGEMRYTDVAARYGGDEFVSLLAETPVRGALAVAERIRVASAARLAIIDGVPTNSTVSIGLATYPEDGRTLDELVGSADRGLSRAKAQGRNCVARGDAAAAPAEPEPPIPTATGAASPPPA